jgi:hypothetical protein
MRALFLFITLYSIATTRLCQSAILLVAGQIPSQTPAKPLPKPQEAIGRPIPSASRQLLADIVVEVLRQELLGVGSGERYVGLELNNGDIADIEPKVLEVLRKTHPGLRPAADLLSPTAKRRFGLTTVSNPTSENAQRFNLRTSFLGSEGNYSGRQYTVTLEKGGWKVRPNPHIGCGRWQQANIDGRKILPHKTK